MPKPKKGSYRTTEELEPLRAASANINDASGADGGAWWHEAPPSGSGAVGKKAPVSALAYVSSSSTKGDLDYADEGRYSANVPPRTACDLVSFILFILFTACALIAGGISLGAGAYWLHAVLDNKPLADCFILLLSAALPLGLGGFIILLLVGITIVSTCFCVMPHSALSSVKGCCAKAVRIVFLHVIPFVCLLLGVGGSIAALYFSTMARSQPDLNRNFDRVAGLDGPVTISRDSNGLVHISANSRRDVLFGQGVAHGQDRLWQVEFQRLVGRGRLSEFVGSAGKKMDKQIRTLNFPAGARRMCENASPANRALVQRYIDGLNFYVSQYSERPAEFLIMGRKLLHIHQPEPFEAMDSCLIAMLLMWQMGANIPTEVQRFKIFWHTDRTFDEVNELFINHTNISSTILSSAQMGLTEADAVAARAREADDEAIERHLYDTHMAALREQHNPNGRYSKDGRSSGRPDDNEDGDDDEVSAARRSMTAQDILSREAAADADADAGAGCLSEKQQKAPAAANPKEAPFFTFADFVQNSLDLLDITAPQASNAWAARAPIVAGDAAADGSHPTIGASDPHLGINVPSVWHWTRLTFPTESGEMYDAAGVGLPGLPGVHIGKTTNTSWGITMSMTDLGDLFLITPDPARPSTHYMANGASEPFTFRRESIRVKGSSDTVELSIAETVYGPIATEALGLPHPLLFAVRTDFLRDDTTSLDGLLCLNEPTTQTAKDVRDRCLSRIRSPGFSIPIEDRHGGFAYSLTGAHPKRARGHTGRFPTLGNGSFDYQGFIPHAELPTLAVSRAESNAKGGFIAAANQKTYPDGYKHSLGYDFVYPYRGARIQQALRDPAAYLAEAERTKARAAALASGEGGNTDDSANNNNRLAAIDPATALSNVDFHLTVQRDVRSNQAHDWFSNILNVSAYNNNDGGNDVNASSFSVAASAAGAGVLRFHEVLAEAAAKGEAGRKAKALFDFMTNEWDRMLPIGDTHGALFWLWVRTLYAVPTDAIAANSKGLDKKDEDKSRYWAAFQSDWPIKMVRSPTLLMRKQCKAFYPSATAAADSAAVCGEVAALLWVDVAAGYDANAKKSQWGKHYNQMTTKHLMLEGTILDCAFQRTVAKSGDMSSVDVSDFKVDKKMGSSFASSMRQVYDWSAGKTNAIHFALPGGQSGNPFSEFFQNLLLPFQSDSYVLATAEGNTIAGGAKYTQTLRP